MNNNDFYTQNVGAYRSYQSIIWVILNAELGRHSRYFIFFLQKTFVVLHLYDFVSDLLQTL